MIGISLFGTHFRSPFTNQFHQKERGVEFEKETMKEAYNSIENGLEEQYKGFIENPDQ